MLQIRRKRGKAIPVQVWTGFEGSRNLRLPDFKTIGTWNGQVVSHTHRPPLPGIFPGDKGGQRVELTT